MSCPTSTSVEVTRQLIELDMLRHLPRLRRLYNFASPLLSFRCQSNMTIRRNHRRLKVPILSLTAKSLV